jgi:hypothetical protein
VAGRVEHLGLERGAERAPPSAARIAARRVPCEPAAASARSSRSIGRDTTWTTPPSAKLPNSADAPLGATSIRSTPSGEIARQ